MPTTPIGTNAQKASIGSQAPADMGRVERLKRVGGDRLAEVLAEREERKSQSNCSCASLEHVGRDHRSAAAIQEHVADAEEDGVENEHDHVVLEGKRGAHGEAGDAGDDCDVLQVARQFVQNEAAEWGQGCRMRLARHR